MRYTDIDGVFSAFSDNILADRRTRYKLLGLSGICRNGSRNGNRALSRQPGMDTG